MTSILQTVSCMDDYDPDALPVAKAQQIVSSLVEPVIGTERLFVRNALGRVLAHDVISPIDVPAHNNSAMDGYGVRAADLAPDAEVSLQVIGSALAGRPFEGDVGPGQAVRIMTGAVLPPSVDTVVIQEVSRVEADMLYVPAGQRSGQNTRRAGEDLKAGTPALAAGRRLVPADIGLIASLGVAEVTVRRRVRVAFFSTGDELVSLGHSRPKGRSSTATATRSTPCSPSSASRSSTWVSCRTIPPAWRRPFARRSSRPMQSSPAAASRSAKRISSSS